LSFINFGKAWRESLPYYNSNNFTYRQQKNLLTQLPFFVEPPIDQDDQRYSYQSSLKTSVIADTTDIIHFYKIIDTSRHFTFKDKKGIRWLTDTAISCPLLWVGSRGWGVYQYFTLNNSCRIAVHYIGNDSANYLSNNLVQSIIKDKNGTIWVATNGGGLNEICAISPGIGQIFFITKMNHSIPIASVATVFLICVSIKMESSGSLLITEY
jgi:hypothetical protein